MEEGSLGEMRAEADLHFTFCSVINKWINGKETCVSANATAINEQLESYLLLGCLSGSRSAGHGVLLIGFLPPGIRVCFFFICF